MTKEEARKIAKLIRINRKYNQEELDKLLIQKIKELNAKTIAIFYPLANEFDLRILMKYFSVCFPKTKGDFLEFYLNPSKFKKGKFSVYEPCDGLLIDKKDIDLMFVPALCVNKKNFRIGYGKGYYDRYLENSNIYTISIVYNDLVLDFLEDSFDVKVNEVILWNKL